MSAEETTESARLAIADPPYPPSRRGRPVGSRWYGDLAHTLGPGSYAADHHPDAAEWDDPARHRALLEELLGAYDGWAIATSVDGVDAYLPLPIEVRRMVWVKPNAMPGPARIHNKHELVLVYPPAGRRTSRGGLGCVPDVLIEPKRNDGFAGAKPPAWTRWVLDALSYNPETDTVDDLFRGSGAVAAATAQGQLVDVIDRPSRPGTSACPTCGWSNGEHNTQVVACHISRPAINGDPL